ncbi:N-acetylmuramoyl-L-alanine amidase [Streptomyces sp. NPDC006684]|uniref:N-acetylmuramoyl-L-alanine amidase n=1 Tax=Streptomyces sp. NPDC006684 TaxID=3154477 RepID=UPI0034556F44
MHERKSKRWLTQAVAAGAVAAGTLAFLPAPAQAQGAPPHDAGLQADFAAAAASYGVPTSVLMAVTHEESGWRWHKGYSESGGYGLADLTDVTADMLVDGDAGAGGRADLAAMVDKPELHTLRKAAKLTGIPAARLRTDRRANLDGAAALLASYQKSLKAEASKDPADWTGAVAEYSGLKDEKAARGYVDNVFRTIRSGASLRQADGNTVRLAADASARPAAGRLAGLKLRTTAAAPDAECPASLSCAFDPVPIAANGQVSDRPANGIAIDRIVLHTAEGSFASAKQSLSAPGAVSGAHYLMDTDGTTTQLMANKDLAFAVGNYHYNLHSVSIEQAGFTARGADWYTDAVYQRTAELVKYLAERYDVPLDRQHVLGHDNVPGSLDSNLAAQHWDKGTAWDWNRFMRLLGAPTDAGTRGVGKAGSVVTIAPKFGTSAEQTYTVCPADDPSGATPACAKVPQPSNSLFVRTAPAADAPLFLDPVVHPGDQAGTDAISDWSDRVQAGQQFVVAGREGDWTAIWYGGQKGWIYNPGGRNTIPAKGVKVIKTRGTTAAPVYGQAYPEASEYPAGLSPSTQKPLTAANYGIPVGQAYVADQPPTPADDYFKSGGEVVTGSRTYYQVQFNHRTIYVNSADVTATPAC